MKRYIKAEKFHDPQIDKVIDQIQELISNDEYLLSICDSEYADYPKIKLLVNNRIKIIFKPPFGSKLLIGDANVYNYRTYSENGQYVIDFCNNLCKVIPNLQIQDIKQTYVGQYDVSIAAYFKYFE